MWISEADLQDILGRESAAVLTRVLGGGRVYVPAKASADHNLAGILGLRGMEILCAAHAGETLYLPNGREKATAKRRAKLLLAQGKSLNQVADACDITVRYASEIAREWRQEQRAPQQGNLLGV